MSKVFKVDDFTITLEDALFDKAVECFVLERGDDEEEKRGNYLHLLNNIEAAYTKSLEDVGKVKLSDIRQNYSDEEISAGVKRILLFEIKLNGGVYP